MILDYSIPEKPEDFIHRVGRVGRAERMVRKKNKHE